MENNRYLKSGQKKKQHTQIANVNNKTSTIMEDELLKILENCNNNLIDAETAQLQVLDLFSVVGSFPTNKDIALRAETYAYKTRKNFSGYEKVLMKIAYQKGCYWMRKKATK